MKQDNHPYIHWGVTIFLSLSAVAGLVFVMFRFREIWHIARTILGALSPIYIGFALSYILRPMAKRMEVQFRKAKGFTRFARPTAVILSVIIALALVAAFFVMVVPQLVSSISGLVVSLPGLIEESMIRIEAFLQHEQGWSERIIQMISAAEAFFTNWLQNNLLDSLGTLASNVITFGSFLVNLLMSIIVAVYLLLGWEHYLAQIKKLFLAVSPNKRFNRIVFTAMEQTNRIFSGFINGKLLDSLIVGVISFICLSVMQMPYALLISVIVGVTNIVPVFGPFIGAVPSAFLVLLISPAKCLAFLIFIVILQQIDGNIIGPRILGDSTGLSALYVMTAMLLFGKLLGFLGMVIGVPLFATLYYVVKQLAEYSLKKQNLTLDTAEYEAPGMPGRKE